MLKMWCLSGLINRRSFSHFSSHNLSPSMNSSPFFGLFLNMEERLCIWKKEMIDSNSIKEAKDEGALMKTISPLPSLQPWGFVFTLDVLGGLLMKTVSRPPLPLFPLSHRECS